jgi:ribosomal protein S20
LLRELYSILAQPNYHGPRQQIKRERFQSTFYPTDNGSPNMVGQLQVVIVVIKRTPSEWANDIMVAINGMELPKEIVNSYAANIKKVGPFVDAGQVTAAINQLNALVNKVSTEMSKGIITTSNGNNLISMANALTAALKGR